METDQRIQLLEVAQAFYDLGDLGAAEDVLQEIHFPPEEVKGRLFAVFSMTRGSVMADSGRLAAAEQDFCQAQAAFEADNEPLGQAQALFNLGNVAGRGGAGCNARARYREARAKYEAAKDTALARYCLIAIAYTCSLPDELGELNSALAEYTPTAEDERTLPPLERCWLASAERHWAAIATNSIAELEYAEIAVAAARESGLDDYIGEALLALGKVYVAHNQSDLAKVVLRLK